jgi:hypothetical protein
MGNSEMRMFKRKATTYMFLLAAACAGVGVSFLVLAPSAAQARDYPYCIKGDYYQNGIGDCSFDTYQQCLRDSLRSSRVLRRESVLSFSGGRSGCIP